VRQEVLKLALQNYQDSIPIQEDKAIRNTTFPTSHLLDIPTTTSFLYLQTMAANNYAVMGRGTDNLRDNKPYVLSKYSRISNIGRSIGLNNFKELSVVRGAAAFKYGIGTNGEVLNSHFPVSQENQASTTVTIQGGTQNTAAIGVHHTGSNKIKNVYYQVNAVYQRGEDFTFQENVVNTRDIKSTITFPTIVTQGYIDNREIGREVVKTDGRFTDTYENILTDFEINWMPTNKLDIAVFGGYQMENCGEGFG